MSKHSAWLIALVMVGLAVVVATTAAYFLLPPQQMGDVAVPPRDATPEQVVTAYLALLTLPWVFWRAVDEGTPLSA